LSDLASTEAVGISPGLRAQVTRLYGTPAVASLPEHDPDGDTATEFAALARQVADAGVVLFAPLPLRALDGFFRLRLTQILAGQAAHPGLAVVLLDAPAHGRLAGGFAERVLSAWPFARTVFLTEHGDPAMLSRALGLPVARLGDAVDIVHSMAAVGQQIAIQLQPIWRGCGATTAFENQVESLVQAGYLTIRIFTDKLPRRGPELDALLQQAIAENSVDAGAHINVLAVPDQSGAPVDVNDPDAAWAFIVTGGARSHIRDAAIRRATGQATAAVANLLETVGLAVTLAPRARLLLDVQLDSVMCERDWMTLDGKSETEIQAAEAAAERFQARIMAIPDVCAHVNETEHIRLAALNPRSVLLLPRVYARPAPAQGSPRFDVLLVGDEHWFNIRSLQWFLHEVWRPYLEAEFISVAIAGRAGAHVRSSVEPSLLLHFLGFVEDLEVLRSACRISAVPDQSGTGIAIKTLTALAVGHPVVTTSRGLRGLPGAVFEALPAHDDPATFAADILGLCDDPRQMDARRSAVRQAQRAITDGPGYAALLHAVPLLTPQDASTRQARWAEIAAGPAT
jgi:hypothetical protein